MPPLVGVLALQGGFEAHERVLEKLDPTHPRVREVRTVADLDGLDALVIPGGESTTMTLGIEREGLAEPLRELARTGMPILGSCAGLIMLDRDHLGIMDIRAQRNAFGRQLQSFETDLHVRGLHGGLVHGEPARAEHARGEGARAENVSRAERVARGEGPGVQDARPLRAVFIRAPWIAEHGPDVEVLAEVEGHPVAARQGSVLAVAFHAELTEDDRLHRLLLEQIAARR